MELSEVRRERKGGQKMQKGQGLREPKGGNQGVWARSLQQCRGDRGNHTHPERGRGT